MSPGRKASNVEVVDAALLAARGATLEQTFRLQELQRLAEWSEGEEASLTARFYMVERRVGIAGHASAALKLTCQRCLKPMIARVDDDFDLVIVESEAEMDRLSEQQEAVVADASRLDLSWLIEEQLLLAMPLVPVHDDSGACSKSSAAARPESEAKRSAAKPYETQRPFANLRDLLVADDEK